MRPRALPVLLSLIAGTLLAQSVKPDARDAFSRAMAASAAGNAVQAVDELRKASALDGGVWGLPDGGQLDRVLASLKKHVADHPSDGAVRQRLAWMYFAKGMQNEALAEYRSLAAAGQKDAEVTANIRTLESWIASSGSAARSGAPPAASGGCCDPAAPASAASPASSTDESAGLKDAIKKKDEEIAGLQKEKEELQAKLDELAKEQKDLQLYKTQYLIRTPAGETGCGPAPGTGSSAPTAGSGSSCGGSAPCAPGGRR